ncbi:hypothetical protein GOP47_0012185 [Adiantum capillus-veneris]|uniref:Uncharacterized protein n=1 Tax=Adiantum capillus-veneris TaxID=13818 RepID=A0A9D4UQ81_ADICA|nr:hypothetical protein GOP47_0012185 [Adiantum capillus-veneris]
MAVTRHTMFIGMWGERELPQSGDEYHYIHRQGSNKGVRGAIEGGLLQLRVGSIFESKWGSNINIGNWELQQHRLQQRLWLHYLCPPQGYWRYFGCCEGCTSVVSGIGAINIDGSVGAMQVSMQGLAIGGLSFSWLSLVELNRGADFSRIVCEVSGTKVDTAICGNCWGSITIIHCSRDGSAIGRMDCSSDGGKLRLRQQVRVLWWLPSAWFSPQRRCLQQERLRLLRRQGGQHGHRQGLHHHCRLLSNALPVKQEMLPYGGVGFDCKQQVNRVGIACRGRLSLGGRTRITESVQSSARAAFSFCRWKEYYNDSTVMFPLLF